MAIKFRDDDGAKPADKTREAGAAPAPQAQPADASTALPFAKPVKAEKKGRKDRKP